MKFKQPTETHWISLSDMMSGLMLVFMLISMTFISIEAQKAKEARQEEKRVKELAKAYEQTHRMIYNDLKNEFSYDLSRWNAEIIEKEYISFRFMDVDVYFDVGKAEIKPKFKDILKNFWPRLLKIILKYKENILEFRIEGHTSSEWYTATNVDSAYIFNMELSQERARNVLIYLLEITNSPQEKYWAKSHLVSMGFGSSKLLYDRISGSEDKVRSRRVEFTIITDSFRVIKEILTEKR